MRERLTQPQKDALTQIYYLNLNYVKRWFTICELDHVVFSTLDSLVKRGYLETKHSAANKKVRYFRWTGRAFEDMYSNGFKKIDM